MYFNPIDSCIPNIPLDLGNIRDTMCFKTAVILFHKVISFGKMLFLCLYVFVLISWYTRELTLRYNGCF